MKFGRVVVENRGTDGYLVTAMADIPADGESESRKVAFHVDRVTFWDGDSDIELLVESDSEAFLRSARADLDVEFSTETDPDSGMEALTAVITRGE